MTNLQFWIILVYGLISLSVMVKGFVEVYKKDNAFGGGSVLLFLLGIFVWGDAVILGLFWILTVISCLLLKDWTLFLLVISLFWMVRSFGEIVYWISQQFSPIMRNPPENLMGYGWFKNDSIWFVYQVFWQCLLVVSIVASIYLSNQWVKL